MDELWPLWTSPNNTKTSATDDASKDEEHREHPNDTSGGHVAAVDDHDRDDHVVETPSSPVPYDDSSSSPLTIISTLGTEHDAAAIKSPSPHPESQRSKTETIVEEIVFPDDTIRRRKLILNIDSDEESMNGDYGTKVRPSGRIIRTETGEVKFIPASASAGAAAAARGEEAEYDDEGREEGRIGSKDKHPWFAPSFTDTRLKQRPSPTGTTHSVFIPRKMRIEPWYHIHMEVAIPFLIAGMGMVMAGYLLDVFSCYPAFLHIRELVVMITPLLGLKGTMEMTLAARLCTHVNLGHMDSWNKRIKAAIDDMLLSQVQAILCGVIAAVLAMILVQIEQTPHDYHAPLLNHVIVVCAISILTAMTSSLIIGFTVIFVVFSTDKCSVNPDNIATPIIACLGDVLTLVLLSFWGDKFYVYLEKSTPNDSLEPVAVPLVTNALIVFAVLPCIIFASWKDESSKTILKHCWLPVLSGIIISTIAGSILEKEGMQYTNMNFYQPVINFVGGNLASIQYNRISTAYCRDTELGTLPKLANGHRNKVCHNPYAATCSQGQHTTSYWVLMSLVIPSQINFAMLTYFLIPKHVPDCFVSFLSVYLLAGLIQTAFLMYITLTLTNYLWSRKYDPDSYVIPLVTATSDLIGTSFLFFVCFLVYGTNESCAAGYDPDSKNHEHCQHGHY